MLRIFLTPILFMIVAQTALAGQADDPVQAIIDKMAGTQFKEALSRSLEKAKTQVDMSEQQTDAAAVGLVVDESKKIIKQSLQTPESDQKELLIFLSESMPDQEIWRFLSAGIKLKPFFKDVKFLMYGFPQKGVIDQYAEKHDRNIYLSIDPFLFEAHGIEHVPVVILGDYRVDAPLTLSEALELIGDRSAVDYEKEKYELQLP